jgi:hypothetical protein
MFTNHYKKNMFFLTLEKTVIFEVSFAGGSLLEHPAWSFASLPAAANASSYDGPFRLR